MAEKKKKRSRTRERKRVESVTALGRKRRQREIATRCFYRSFAIVKGLLEDSGGSLLLIAANMEWCAL